MNRNLQKSKTLILKNDFNSQNFNYVPHKELDDKRKERCLNEFGNDLPSNPQLDKSKPQIKESFLIECANRKHSNPQLDKSKLHKKDSFQLDQDYKQTPILKKLPNRIVYSTNHTPIVSQQEIKINILKKQLEIGSMYYHTSTKGQQISDYNIDQDISQFSPLRQSRNIHCKGSEPNLKNLKNIDNLSLDKASLLTLNNFSQNHSINNLQNKDENNLQTKNMRGKSLAVLPNGTTKIKLSSMENNLNEFIIKQIPTKLPSKFNGSNKIDGSTRQQQSPFFGSKSPIELDLRVAIKSNAKRSMMELSPARSSFVDLYQPKSDQYISIRHSSIAQLEENEDGKTLIGKVCQKKKISPQTSNALLPQSFVNQLKIQKIQASNSIQIYDKPLSPLGEVKNNGNRLQNMERILQQQRLSDSQFSGDFSSRFDSKRTIRDFKETNEKLSNYNPEYTNIQTNTSIHSPIHQNEVILENKSQQFTDFKQTPQQKDFQTNFLIKIRRKHQTRFTQQIQSLKKKLNVEVEELGFNNKESEENRGKKQKKRKPISHIIFEQSLDTKQIVDDDTSTQNLAQKVQEISEDFRKLLLNEIRSSQSELKKNYLFFQGEIDPKVFIDGIIFLFRNSLSISLTNDYNVKKKKFTYKIPEKFFNLILNIFRIRILEERYQFNEAQINRFEYLLLIQYEDLQLKPKNLLEQLGGVKKCQILISDFYQLIYSRLELKEQMADKQLQELGLAFLKNDEEGISNFINHIKRTQRILEKDLFSLKHALYHFLYTDKNEFFDEDIKKYFLINFEKIRYQYLTTFTQVETQHIQRDIFNYLITKKPILEYFEEENKLARVQFFIIQIINCFMYKTKTHDIVLWIKQFFQKPIDQSFFMMIEPLFIEQFKRLMLGYLFIRNSELKFQWLKIELNVIQGVEQVLERMDELLLNMNNWINGMIAQNQLNKQQMQQINHIQNVSFLKYFLYSTLNSDLFNSNDIYFMINTFQTSKEAVLFQLKGLKRILLLMRFKHKEAYEIAEFLIKTFNEAFHCASYSN